MKSLGAYREIQQRERRGERGFKKQIYKNLAQRFGRTDKAFEFRMQNISAVLSLLGRDWVSGLKPAQQVGSNIAVKLERFINELDGNPDTPKVNLALESQEGIKRPPKVQPAGRRNPVKSTSTTTLYARDPEVKAWVLKRSQGICECCKTPAPFLTVNGTPFLEVHHLRMLMDGGSDQVSNAVALCPNCHRRFHYGIDVHQLKDRLLEEINELKRE